jgi:hypothetical protein
VKTYAELIDLLELFNEPFTFVKEFSDGYGIAYDYKGAKGGIVQVIFGLQQDTVIVNFTVDDSISIRGEGDAPRVFASVMDAFKRFLTKRQPKYFVFSANKADYDLKNQTRRPTSRPRVYAAMIKRLAPQYGYKLKQEKDVTDRDAFGGNYDSSTFILQKIKR